MSYELLLNAFDPALSTITSASGTSSATAPYCDA